MKFRPSYPFRINRGSIQSEGLEFIVSAGEQGGLIIGPLIPPQNGQIIYNGASSVFRGAAEDYGFGFDIVAASSGFISFPLTEDDPFISASGITVIWSGVIDNILTTSFKHFAGKHTLSGAVNNPFDFRTDNSGSLILTLVRANAGGLRIFTGPSVTFDTYLNIAVRVSDNLIETVPDFFVDGVRTAGTLSSGTGTGAVTGSNGDIRIGRRADGAVQMDGVVTECRFYNRAISDNAIQELSNPQTRFNLYLKNVPSRFLDVDALAASPFKQTEWPISNTIKRSSFGFINSSASFIPPPEPFSNSQKNWPIPLTKGRQNTGWLDYFIFDDQNIRPSAISVFPNNFPKKKINNDWIQTRPQYFQDNKPFKQDQWPNPRLKFKQPQFHIHNRKIDEPPTPEPFKVPLFPNPLRKERIRQDWNDRFSIVRQDVRPVGNSSIDLPLPKLLGEVLSWINPRPSYYEEIDPAVPPFRQVNWPNPVIARRVLGIINRHFLDSPSTTFPFNQHNWPLPLRKKLGIGWIDNYVIDDNVPFVAQVAFVPLGKSSFVPTWLNFSPNVVNDGTPIVQLEYPNPIIVKQQTKGFIDNLLQRDLNPGAGDKPFNQNDYPNPIIGKLNFPSGWINERRFYSEEPPLQIGQFDWPKL
jgi:hypothetical protein